jgi:outer membrane protein OmpA-like peptidoglycan-associated protein
MTLRVLVVFLSLLALHQSALAAHPDARKASIDANPYHLDPGGHGVLSVGSPEVLAHFELRAFLVAQHLNRPIGVAANESNEWLRSLVDNRQQFDLGASFGLFGRLELSLLLPIIVHQSGEFPGQGMGATAPAGLGQLLFQPKVAIFKEETAPVGLAVALPLSFPTGNSEAWMGTGGMGFEPRVMVSRSFGPVQIVATLGYLFQPRSEIFDLVDDDKATLRAAVRLRATRWLDIGLEYTSAVRAEAPFQNADEVSGELALGVRVLPGKGFAIRAGFGTGMPRGVPAPLARVAVGVSWQRELLQDRDGDGLLAPADKCPREPEDKDGYEDEDGCPELDNDGDGIEDEADQCPEQAEDIDSFEDEDGCPELDNDQDSIADLSDACPLEAEDRDGFEDEDGCPEPDNDQDGILDGDDLCPQEPEVFNDEKDEDGCPDDVLAVLATEEIVILEKLYFSSGKANLLRRSFAVLVAVAALLEDNPRVRKIRIEGHTDNVGEEEANQTLSQRRADEVLDRLAAQGVNPARLEAVGYGESRGVSDNETPEGRARNRRVVFTILKQDLPEEPPLVAEPELSPVVEPAAAEPAAEEPAAAEPAAAEPAAEEPAAEAPAARLSGSS